MLLILNQRKSTSLRIPKGVENFCDSAPKPTSLRIPSNADGFWLHGITKQMGSLRGADLHLPDATSSSKDLAKASDRADRKEDRKHDVPYQKSDYFKVVLKTLI